MQSSIRDELPLIEKLEYNYLINDDEISLKTLISLFETKNFKLSDDNSYYLKDSVLKNLRKYFWNLANIDQIIESLDKNIGKDLTRFECLLGIKARYRGLNNKLHVDELEYKAIEYYGASFLFENSNIFNDDCDLSFQMKDYYSDIIRSDKQLISELNEEILEYAEKYLRKKILSLDINVNKQLAFDIDYIYTDDITLEQSVKIYNKMVSYLSRSSIDVYAKSYWEGLVQGVVNRYH